MQAVVFTAPGQLSITELPEPEPGPGELLLRPVVTGVCGTDLHLLAGGFLARYPLVPGHEVVAEVVSHRPGDRVTGDRNAGRRRQHRAL